MNLVVISPPGYDPREADVVTQLIAAGLARYHVRKPEWSQACLASWLEALSAAVRAHLVLHQHHVLVERFGFAGRHWRDTPGVPLAPLPSERPASRTCHDLAGLRNTFGRYDTAFFAPVFPSVSKPGHGDTAATRHPELAALLATRDADARRTAVFALGGITRHTAPVALALGFDGVAVLGAVWQADEPVRAYVELKRSLSDHAVV